MLKIQNYINGKLIDPISNNYIDNYEPATGKVFSQIAQSGATDVENAVETARKAFPSWSELSADDRAVCMDKIADLILKNLDELALAESKDNGKPIWMAKQVDIPRASKNMSFFASAIRQFHSEFYQSSNQIYNYVLRQPLGIIGAISPWNLPLYLFTWKIAPALAAGNCVIAKPSEVTPYTAYLFSKICIEAGLPAGVLNIVHGYGGEVGEAIVKHKEIKAITFTGGTSTGKHIAGIAAPMLKKLSLELGGKNPTIVMDDCNYEKTVKETVRAAFANQGEICLCGSRILVHEKIYEQFKKDFIEETKKLKTGSPYDDSSKIGAIVSEQHFKKILSYIELAEEEGGKLLTGGKAFNPGGEFKNGWYIEPTVFEGLPQNCRTNTEEIFGPVATLQSFKNIQEAIELANGTEYGLAASIWTENLSAAHQLAAKVDCGIIWINAWLVRDLRIPFGGMKQSGVGREGGEEALKFFTEPKSVCMKF
ncbi:MAG: aldehyde dehydrogenase [Chitinophagaceae bacterium]|nr:MAG: aldehyde dehydrogenase [Chitinophagaceae bacterium]